MGKFESRFLKFGGFALIFLGVYFLFKKDAASGTVSAAVGLMLIFLSRISEFKRFKGWGFEAEMWDDKLLEAERLMDSMKSIAKIASREIVLQSVKSGRFGNGKRWEDHWRLFEEIRATQGGLLTPQSVKEIRKSVDRWFLHDMISNEFGSLVEIVNKGADLARRKIRENGGDFEKRTVSFDADLQSVFRGKRHSVGLFELAGEGPFVEALNKWWHDAKSLLEKYDVQIEIPPEIQSKLDTFKALEGLPEMPVTPALISAADR